jgi:HAD superfamily hydrolase (TIGR01509 family)
VGVDAATFQELYWLRRDAFDVDAVDAPTYYQQMGTAVGITYTPEQIRQLAALDGAMWGRPNPAMVAWVRVLRERGMRTAILSNMPAAICAYLRRTARWFDLFDHLCLSGELRTGKPGAAIYHSCLQALGVEPGATLFIDDREENIATARALGMNGIVFRSAAELGPELAPYGLAASWAEAQRRTG